MIIINNKLSDFNGKAGLRLDNVVLEFANRFYTDGGVLTTNDFVALHTLVASYKSENLFDKAKNLAHYPFVGGSGNAQSITNFRHNLWSSSFKLTSVNVTGAMCTANGYTGNGTSSYWDTLLMPSTSLLLNNVGLSFYKSVFNLTSFYKSDMGNSAAASSTIQLTAGFDTTNNVLAFQSYSGVNLSDMAIKFSSPSYLGFCSGSKLSSSSISVYLNGVREAISTSIVNQGTLPSQSIFLGCRRNEGTPIFFSDARYTMFQISEGYTLTEETKRFQIQQTFERMLSRAIEF